MDCLASMNWNIEPGFLLIMGLTLAFSIFATWRAFEQDKREKLEGKETQPPKSPHVLL